MENEINKSKRFLITALLVTIAFWIIIAILIVSWKTKPVNDSISVPGIERQVYESDCILAKIFDNEYYEVDGSDEFGELFGLDEWESIPDEPTGNVCLTLRFAEQFILKIYDNGEAAAFNGYSSSDTIPYAYYKVPGGLVDSATAYLRQYGTAHELGDGAVGLGTFLY